MSDARSESTDELLRALPALQAADRDERAAAHEDLRRSEFVLTDAGFSPSLIAAVLGRNRESVKSTVRRARARS